MPRDEWHKGNTLMLNLIVLFFSALSSIWFTYEENEMTCQRSHGKLIKGNPGIRTQLSCLLRELFPYTTLHLWRGSRGRPRNRIIALKLLEPERSSGPLSTLDRWWKWGLGCPADMSAARWSHHRAGVNPCVLSLKAQGLLHYHAELPNCCFPVQS